MNIRSVTCFVNVDDVDRVEGLVKAAGDLAGEARVALESAGLAVQTMRLATQPLSLLPAEPQQLAAQLWPACVKAGFEYVSLGPVLADAPDADLAAIEQIPDLIRSCDALFAAVLVTQRGRGLHLHAIERTARLIREIARTTPLGFGNLRFAMLANVEPHTPFFPAAYHDGGTLALSLATESADLALAAFSEAASLDDARRRLIASIEAEASRMTDLIRPLARRSSARFSGIDFSLAPFPEEARSIGAAIEQLGGGRFGAPGTLFAAAFLTDCLRQAIFPRCGFNGLMLPVLEDARLAARSREGLFTVDDLLLYSAVCGTGLDTLPLPGDVSEDELAGILLDVATLARRLGKPLTARLMPVPGAKAGDLTQFDFSYFANGRVLSVKGSGSPALFARGDWLAGS